MKTVPLHGKKAAGRVALVDDEDYDLVMQYRWNVLEQVEPGKRPVGPYAKTTRKLNGRYVTIRMHVLIMGAKGIDHRDHNGLNNQRSNLRVATGSQNNQNMRSALGSTSPYKGVYWSGQKRRWHAEIGIDGSTRHLGFYVSEIEAALAYDNAALESFGEFACPNFPDGVPQELEDRLRTEREAAASAAAASRARRSAQNVSRWTQRMPETYTCTRCGAGFLARAMRPALYCSKRCKGAAQRHRKRQQALEGRLS